MLTKPQRMCLGRCFLITAFCFIPFVMLVILDSLAHGSTKFYNRPLWLWFAFAVVVYASAGCWWRILAYMFRPIVAIYFRVEKLVFPNWYEDEEEEKKHDDGKPIKPNKKKNNS